MSLKNVEVLRKNPKINFIRIFRENNKHDFARTIEYSCTNRRWQGVNLLNITTDVLDLECVESRLDQNVFIFLRA